MQRLVDNRYRIVKLLGSGGMAEVHLAHDEVLERDVALKILHRRYADEEEFVERFRREARKAASLAHPKIVSVHDLGKTEDGTHYIVMEYVPGGTLKDLIFREAPLPPSATMRLALQIARALEVAHHEGIVHRDVKPQNVLLSESVEAKVADFGIARAASETTLTRTGEVLGTPHYMSPEQARGEPASVRSDLYALGVTLYETLTAELPFDAETPAGIIYQHLNGQLRSPTDIDPNIPEQANAVVVRLLTKDPRRRYTDAAALVEDLERVLRSFGDDDRRDEKHLQSSSNTADEDRLNGSGSPTVRVPDLVGMNAFEASSLLSDMGLALHI